MVYHRDADNLCLDARNSRQDANQHMHDCCSDMGNNESIQMSQKIRISSAIRRLKAKETIPNDIDVLPNTNCVREISTNKSYRPNSANIVLQYADVPIQITNHPLGRPTKGTVLRNLRRSQSASSVCSNFSWITDNRRLCNIRDYYRLCKPKDIAHSTTGGESVHAFLTGARFTSAHWLDSVTLGKRGLYINKEDLGNVFQVPNPPYQAFEKSKIITAKKEKAPGKDSLFVSGTKMLYHDVGTNTEQYYLSLKTWHNAEWQKELPAMYGPRPDKYNPNVSVAVRAKRVKSEYRDPVRMAKLVARSKSAT